MKPLANGKTEYYYVKYLNKVGIRVGLFVHSLITKARYGSINEKDIVLIEEKDLYKYNKQINNNGNR
jgi:hypothetical protein